MARKSLFHKTEDGSETWHLIAKDDGTYWVEHAWPSGSETVTAGAFIATLPDDSTLLRLVRAAITKTLM